jgi:hypothetical protein
MSSTIIDVRHIGYVINQINTNNVATSNFESTSFFFVYFLSHPPLTWT